MPRGDSATPAVYHAAQRQERLLSLLGLLSLLSLLSHSTQGGPYFSEQPMHLDQEDQVDQVDQVDAVFSLVTERATGIRNVLPDTGTNFQSYPFVWKVMTSTPNVLPLKTSLLGC